MFVRLAFLAATLTLGIANPACADTTILDKLKANRLAVTLDKGTLSGPGAEPLLQASRQAQYVLLGEDHGVAEIAQFSSAYFNALAPAGFTTLVTENGAAVAGALEGMLKRPDAVAAIAKFHAAYPDAIAFYTMRQEAEMLASFALAAGPRFQQWGIDQEFVGAAKYLIAQMLAQPVNPAARAKLEALRQKEAVAYQKAVATGNPLEYLLLSAASEDLDSLRPLLAGPKEKTALGLLDALLESRAIYQKSISKVAGDRDISNLMRVALLKRTLSARLGAQEQKLLVKVGAYHAYKGVNPLGNRDIGNFLAERAEGQGRTSLHLIVLAAKGTQLRFAGAGKPPRAAPFEVDSSAAKLLASAGLTDGSWSLFDLRPLRPGSNKLAAGDIELFNLINGYDFAVMIPEGSASAQLGTP
ncbi:hypothetical protein KW842_02645 [Duganella sp. sic0402]|uniref:hypothetical protein n=1 Tax=Duganella sp. sic0402 TaxID=2854786 RepID=UPI001C48F353|nr:hypothetical protein [Duganella sp. sic0402]MBV7534655.1 hypothetical protein [Duganella sp. sic0402]